MKRLAPRGVWSGRSPFGRDVGPGLAAFSLPLVLAGLACGGAAEPPDGPPAPQDRPAAAIAEPDPGEPSALWKAAVGAGSGSKECALAKERLAAEGACKAALCAPGRDLAKEWPLRCAKVLPDGVAVVKALAGDLATRAAQTAGACATEHAAVLKGSCGRDVTCEATAQRWGARCGKAEATPLAIVALEAAVAAKRAGKFQLDVRSCDELRAWVLEGARCADKQACLGVVKRVDEYRGRCGAVGDLPTASFAAAELSILSGAGRETAPTVVKPDSARLTPADLPVVLEDGWGAVLSVCGHRTATLTGYVEARAACEKGKLSMVRVFKTKAKDVDVRIGVIEFPSDAEFWRRYSTVRAAGELEIDDRAELPGFEAELAAAATLGADARKVSAAAEALIKAVSSRGAALQRSAALRAALGAKDADLVGPLRAIGEAKAAAAESLGPVDLAGLVQRGARCAFADTTEAGTVEDGALGPAWALDTRALMPRAMAAYDGAMEEANKRAAKKKLGPAEAARAKAQAKEQASACGAAFKKIRAAEQSLIACGFAVEPCDAARTAAVRKEQDVAFAAAEKSRLELDRAMTGGGYPVRAEIAQIAAAAGCIETWW